MNKLFATATMGLLSVGFSALTLTPNVEALEPPSQAQSASNSERTTLPASALGGKVELDCETRLNFLRTEECSAGEGEEPLLNIPTEPFRSQQNLNQTTSDNDQNRLDIFNIRF